MGVLIAYSSSAHRNLDLLPTREVPLPHGAPCGMSCVLRCCLLHPPAELRDVKRSGPSFIPEGPGERPTADRQIEAGRYGVHVRTPAGQRTAMVGDTLATDQHHTQQIDLGRPLPAAHTGALGARPGTRPARHCLSLPPRAHPAPAGGEGTTTFTDGTAPGAARARPWSPADIRPAPGPGGCRSASRSAGPPAGHSALPSRWPATAGSRVR
jgi:hypothetical protein